MSRRSQAKSISSLYTLLRGLLITQHSPGDHRGANRQQSERIGPDIGQRAALDVDTAHGIGIIAHRVEIGDGFGPVGHGGYRCENTADEHEHHHEKPGDEHGLLGIVAVVGNKQPHAGRHQDVAGGEQIDQSQRAGTGIVKHEPGDEQTGRQNEKGHQPIGNQFAKYENATVDGRHVDLLDGAALFLAHDVERGEKAGEHRNGNDNQGGHHEFLIIEVFVEIIFGREFHPAVGCGHGLGGRNLCGLETADTTSQITGADTAFRPVDGVHLDADRQFFAPLQQTVEIRTDGQNGIGLIAVHQLHGPTGIVADIDQIKITGRGAGADQFGRGGRAVAVDNDQINVADFHAHGKRKHEHHQHGKRNGHLGQTRIAEKLFEFFFEQIKQYHKHNPPIDYKRLLNKRTLTTSRNTVIISSMSNSG